MNRALLVGINAYPSQPLQGCVNDVLDMAGLITSGPIGFRKRDVRLLTDGRATKAAICNHLGWLTSGLRAGDRALFHYSGHGVQLPTRNPAGEVDNLDEAICPVDFDWTDATTLRDKDFARIFSAVPPGVEFVWVSDSCHSQDLTRDLVPPGGPVIRVKTMVPPGDIDWRLQTAKEEQVTALGMLGAAQSLAKSEINVALVAGCKSDQTSADAVINGRPNGALTFFLIAELKKAGAFDRPLTRVVAETAAAVKAAHYSQDPQLEGAREICGRPFLAR